MPPFGYRLARGILDSDSTAAASSVLATSASASEAVGTSTSSNVSAKASTSSAGSGAGESVTTATAAASTSGASTSGSGSGAWDTVEECYAQGVSNCDWKAHEGAILGGLFGGLALIALVIYLLIKRSRRKAKDRADLDAALRTKSGG